MLIEGRKRAEAEQMASSLDWVVGDAMALPFEDNSFDVYTISFGIRNVVRVQDALKEAYRVLKPGGTFIFLDSLNHNLIYKANRYFRFLRGSRSFSTVIRIPKLSRIRRMESSFAESNISYFGVWTWVFSLLRHILGEKLSYRIYENLERIELGHKYAFKVVGEFKNCKK
jgi:ubiquinone/menaquinone biosynthesis C-methylase UbiE